MTVKFHSSSCLVKKGVKKSPDTVPFNNVDKYHDFAAKKLSTDSDYISMSNGP